MTQLPQKPQAPEKRSRAALLLLAAIALGALSGCGLFDRFKKTAPPPPAIGPVRVAPSNNPPVLLLGEVHDNVAGQRARFADLEKRVQGGWRPAIVMEQFDDDQQDLLTQAQKDCADPECLLRLLSKPGWNWKLYRPVIDLALSYELPLIAGNLSRADASRVVRDGFKTTFDAATIATYRLGGALPDDLLAGQQKEIVAGHCNMLPDMMLPGMINAQVARDVWMAKTILAQRPRDVVLLAGNGHVRKDIGVARWLAVASPTLRVVTEGYEEKGAVIRPGTYDVTHLEPAQPRPDPCAALKK